MKSKFELTVLGKKLSGYAGDGDKPFFLILPGGAYAACAEGEGDPVVDFFAASGYGAFTLRYSTLWPAFPIEKGSHPAKGACFQQAMREVAEAIRMIRSDRATFGSNGKCVVCGFSAGGHLAASYGNGWKGISAEDCAEVRPNAVFLCYAVTRLRQEPDVMMNRAIFGKRETPTEEQIQEFSPVYHVSADTPPTFLWHTVTDESVPVEQTLSMAVALKEKNIPFEIHVYSEGPHASALANGLPAEGWKQDALRFLQRTV